MSSLEVTEEFKRSAVKKLLTSNQGLNATARNIGIAPSTLYGWKKKYAKHMPMKKKKNVSNWTPEQKLEAVIKTASMSEQELGEFLRSNGLHSTDLESFKKDCLPSASNKGRPRLDPEVVKLRNEVKALTKNLRRKDATLSEYAARVVLLKKSHEIWGTKEEDE